MIWILLLVLLVFALGFGAGALAVTYWALRASKEKGGDDE